MMSEFSSHSHPCERSLCLPRGKEALKVRLDVTTLLGWLQQVSRIRVQEILKQKYFSNLFLVWQLLSYSSTEYST